MPHLVNGIDLSIVDQVARNAGAGGIDIAYQRLGSPNAPPVLLIMGIAAQSVAWPDDFCHALAGHALQIIRFDNRDVGLSTHLTGAPPADLRAALAGDLSSAAYTLSDMAADAAGLLTALGLESAHIVGASMGGQIAQTMAIEHPTRVRSLTSMMATTGNPKVGLPSPDAMREVFAGSPAVTREQVIERMLRAARVVGSPGYPGAESEIAARAGLAFDRSHDPAGIARQAVATIASGDRTEQLRHLSVPTLVIHGTADRLCDVSGGRATAEAIPDAELVLIDGMGHDLPPGLRPQLAARIAHFVWRVQHAAVS